MILPIDLGFELGFKSSFCNDLVTASVALPFSINKRERERERERDCLNLTGERRREKNGEIVNLHQNTDGVG